VAPEPVRAVRTLTLGVDSAGGAHEYAAEVRARVESRLGLRVPGKLVSRAIENIVRNALRFSHRGDKIVMEMDSNAAGTTLDAAVKLTVYLTDLSDFAQVNDAMSRIFSAPYPARATVQVAALPKGARVEVDAVLVLPDPA
jgi:signal transduction histidine kinase